MLFRSPHLKTLSVNEALAIGMEDIPEQFLEPGFDRDKPDVLLCNFLRQILRAEESPARRFFHNI